MSEIIDITNADGNNGQPAQGNASADIVDTLSHENNNTMENTLHPEIHAHLSDGNVGSVSVDELRKPEVYTKMNRCVDGGEDEPGLPSFGGFAGILGATLPALKNTFGNALPRATLYNLITSFAAKHPGFYAHCDTHTHDHMDGKTYSETKHIGCGALDRMLNPEYADVYGYDDEDRDFFWELIDTYANVKVLDREHKERAIIQIENNIEKTENGESLSLLNSHKKPDTHNPENRDGIQYFVYHVTGRNFIIDRFAEDFTKLMIENIDETTLKDVITSIPNYSLGEDNKQALTEAIYYVLKEKIMQSSDAHTGATLERLKPAKDLADAGKVHVLKELKA